MADTPIVRASTVAEPGGPAILVQVLAPDEQGADTEIDSFSFDAALALPVLRAIAELLPDDEAEGLSEPDDEAGPLSEIIGKDVEVAVAHAQVELLERWLQAERDRCDQLLAQLAQS